MNDIAKYFTVEDIREILLQEGYQIYSLAINVEYVPNHGKSDFSVRTLEVAYKGSLEKLRVDLQLGRDHLLSEYNYIAEKHGASSVATKLIAQRLVKLLKDPKLVGPY